MKKRLLLFILIGLLLRFLIMPFFAHPDIFWINWGPYYLSEKSILNIYTYFGDYRDNHLFKYPPLAYFVLGMNIALFRHDLPGLQVFATITDMHRWNTWFDQPSIFRDLFVLKLIYLAADIVIILCLLKLLPAPDPARRMVKLWAFNPLILYAVYMYGQFDILPVTGIVVSLLLYKEDRYLAAVLALGIGGMLKHFPFILLPVLLAGIPCGILLKILYGTVAVLPYLIMSIPFIGSRSFVQDVILNSSQYLVEYSHALVNAKTLFLAVYGGIILGALVKWWKTRPGFLLLNRLYLCIISVYFTFTGFHPQFIVWLAPLVILHLAAVRCARGVYAVCICSFFIYTFQWGRNSSSVLLYPMSSIFNGLPSPLAVLNYFHVSFLVPFAKYMCLLALGILIFFNKPYGKNSR